VNEANLALGHEVFSAHGATFVRNRRIPNVWDANHVRDITASTPPEIDALIAYAATAFDGDSRIFHTDVRTPPPFEARMQLDGYIRSEALVSVLEGDLLGPPPPPVDIRPCESDTDWQAYAALGLLDWIEGTPPGEERDPAFSEHMTLANRLKYPPVRFWLAWADGEARGFLNSWEGIEGVGQVENLFVHAQWRKRGIATALLHHCVADARAQGAGPIVIVADPADTPKNIYARLGWRPIAVSRSYRRAVTSP
jgi:GNAT superfamily N-acetyltransferase